LHVFGQDDHGHVEHDAFASPLIPWGCHMRKSSGRHSTGKRRDWDCPRRQGPIGSAPKLSARRQWILGVVVNIGVGTTRRAAVANGAGMVGVRGERRSKV